MERFTVKEAAFFIGASEHKLRLMVKQKQIPHYRIGNRIYFRQEVLNEWIKYQEKLNFNTVNS